VQFQRDELLYERVFAESSLYFYRNRKRFSDWQAVIIYPSRSIEQNDIHPHRNQLNGDQVHRVYLDELGDIRSLSVWIGLMVLTTLDEEKAPQEAKYLLERSSVEQSETGSRAIMELTITIMVYKFERLSRKEIEIMLGITLKETQVYREIKEEGREEGLQQGEQRGREVEARSLILRQLSRRVGELPQDVHQRIETLSLEQLENLGEALLDFTSFADLLSWLEALGG
jgi:predicted transposase/invertase (TIGR01784 family)